MVFYGKFAKAALPHLIPLLKDPNDSMRTWAADALRKLGYVGNP
ncbi:MAG: HEAT repeat domain-containing protein [Synechococcales cyanobacterium RM1_1_8]|nr:HEAT repeat domain-containing protein [Synechococcales cyanobacterium RM1_1_8]